jgi:2-polyprenyl-3-methyl-5-hydroxy-6-metoxy-1,4-benzoquinol methylase
VHREDGTRTRRYDPAIATFSSSTPRLALHVDWPSGDSAAFSHNELVLTGEAGGAGGIADVRVELDGRTFHAARGLPRGGVGSAGFELRLDTEGWSPGTRPVRVVARDSAGAEATFDADVELRPYVPPQYTDEGHREALAAGDTAMWCDTPWLDGSAKPAVPFRVEGWAANRAGVQEVGVYIDGVLHIRAQHGFARPDLAELLGEDAAARVGFTATIDPGECPPGWHRITVVATGASGSPVGMSGLVECLAAEPAAGTGESSITPTLIADRYVPEAHVGYSFEPEHHARYRWAALLAPGRRVLDAGCGTGFGTEMLARAGAARAEGFDVNLEVVEHARSRAGEVATFGVGDLEQIPHAEGSFDLVTCFEAIEHVENPLRALDELRRVLAPGGVLLASTPNRGVYEEGNPHHLSELSSEEFEAALRERFAHVRMLRQQTHATSLLAGDETAALADSAVPIPLDVRKITSVAPGEELYTVAVASEGPLPDLPELAVLGSAVDLAARRREVEAWRERARLAESAVAAERVRAREAGADRLPPASEEGPVGRLRGILRRR